MAFKKVMTAAAALALAMGTTSAVANQPVPVSETVLGAGMDEEWGDEIYIGAIAIAVAIAVYFLFIDDDDEEDTPTSP